MLHHYVFFKFAELDKEANLKEALRMLLSLKKSVPDVIDLDAGLDVLHSESSWDLALFVKLADLSALERYQKHPEHLKVAEFIAKHRTARACADYFSGDRT